MTLQELSTVWILTLVQRALGAVEVVAYFADALTTGAVSPVTKRVTALDVLHTRRLVHSPGSCKYQYTTNYMSLSSNLSMKRVSWVAEMTTFGFYLMIDQKSCTLDTSTEVFTVHPRSPHTLQSKKGPHFNLLYLSSQAQRPELISKVKDQADRSVTDQNDYLCWSTWK